MEHSKGHQAWNLPLATKLRFSFTSFLPFLFKGTNWDHLSLYFLMWFSIWLFENLFLQLSLRGKKWLILVDGGKKENILDDSSTFERMKMTLLEILSYATTPFATGMQLHVACNYFCNYAPFLGVYATMVQLWSPSSQPLDDFCDISSYIFDMHILIVACATKIGQLWSFGKLGTHFL
jgi:hypothetical protein